MKITEMSTWENDLSGRDKKVAWAVTKTDMANA